MTYVLVSQIDTAFDLPVCARALRVSMVCCLDSGRLAPTSGVAVHLISSPFVIAVVFVVFALHSSLLRNVGDGAREMPFCVCRAQDVAFITWKARCRAARAMLPWVPLLLASPLALAEDVIFTARLETVE